MSMVKTTKISCPVCGKESDFTVWQSLNTALDPEAKQALLDGSLFRFVCPHCGHSGKVEYSMLYHDAEHQTMIYLTTPGEVDTVREALAKADAAMGPLLTGYRKRIVLDLETLREKQTILDLGLDDREVELIKLYIYQIMEERTSTLSVEKILFQHKDGKFCLEFRGETSLCVPFPEEVFRQPPSLLKVRAKDDELIVDAQWAWEYLKNRWKRKS